LKYFYVKHNVWIMTWSAILRTPVTLGHFLGIYKALYWLAIVYTAANGMLNSIDIVCC